MIYWKRKKQTKSWTLTASYSTKLVKIFKAQTFLTRRYKHEWKLENMDMNANDIQFDQQGGGRGWRKRVKRRKRRLITCQRFCKLCERKRVMEGMQVLRFFFFFLKNDSSNVINWMKNKKIKASKLTKRVTRQHKHDSLIENAFSSRS